MRVLIISWEYPPNLVGGIGKHVAELMPAFAALVADNDPPVHLDLLTPHAGNAPKQEKLSETVTVHRLEIPSVDPLNLFTQVIDNNRYLATKAQELHSQTPYHLVHIHDWLVASAGIELKHAWKVPLLLTVHATERGRHGSHIPNRNSHQINQMEWQACYEAWRIIVCSNSMVGELQEYFDVPLCKVSVIPNGVDLEPLQSCRADRLQYLRNKYAPQAEKLLFFVGRITPEKGVQVLLRAMPLLQEKYPNVRLLVAGKNSEQMQTLVDELCIGEIVKLLGFIDGETRNCLYNIVDAAIIPSLYEPFGIVALEAMAAGCNIIVSDVGGLSEVVEHRHTGLTTLANDPQSIVWAVEQLFSDSALAQTMREEGLRKVMRFYNWQAIAERTLDTYQAIVAEWQGVSW